jgi:hypothetical protein
VGGKIPEAPRMRKCVMRIWMKHSKLELWERLESIRKALDRQALLDPPEYALCPERATHTHLTLSYALSPEINVTMPHWRLVRDLGKVEAW